MIRRVDVVDYGWQGRLRGIVVIVSAMMMRADNRREGSEILVWT